MDANVLESGKTYVFSGGAVVVKVTYKGLSMSGYYRKFEDENGEEVFLNAKDVKQYVHDEEEA